MFAIKAKNRDLKDNLEKLRKVGEVPAVFYGMKNATTPISISNIEFKKVWHKAGESSAVELTVDGKKIDVLIHDVQTHPVNDEPIHVDFLAIDMNKKITVNIPIEFIGVSPAVKSGTGNLVKIMHEVEVEALPKDLPQNLVVDISSLVDTTSSLTIADIKLPQGVIATAEATEVVASIIEQKEEVEEPTVPVDLSAIEVEKKGKKEEEGGEAEPAS
jgi:large subunit ribosomal protein L25